MAMNRTNRRGDLNNPCEADGEDGTEGPGLADTLIVAAQDASFQEVFLGRRCWYPVRLDGRRKSAIKWIAPYQGRPVSAITCFAKIERIEDYLETGRYKIYFSEPVKLEHPVVAGPGVNQGIQGHRYSVLKRLVAAHALDDLKPWD
jgi:hypothetical protein